MLEPYFEFDHKNCVAGDDDVIDSLTKAWDIEFENYRSRNLFELSL